MVDLWLVVELLQYSLHMGSDPWFYSGRTESGSGREVAGSEEGRSRVVGSGGWGLVWFGVRCTRVSWR